MIRKTNLIAAFVASTSILAFTTTANSMTIFYGEDLSASGGFVPNGNAVQAQNDFLSQLSDFSTENFEGFSAGNTGPLSLSFPAGAGTINGTLTSTGPGRVVSGNFSNFWQSILVSNQPVFH